MISPRVSEGSNSDGGRPSALGLKAARCLARSPQLAAGCRVSQCPVTGDVRVPGKLQTWPPCDHEKVTDGELERGQLETMFGEIKPRRKNLGYCRT